MPRTFNEERTAFSINGVKTPDVYKQRMKLDSYFTPYAKINSHCFKDINIRLETGTAKKKKKVGENSMTLF